MMIMMMIIMMMFSTACMWPHWMLEVKWSKLKVKDTKCWNHFWP